MLSVLLIVYFAIQFTADAKCRSTFYSYTSSPLELKWAKNIQSWQLDVCEHITKAEMEWWISNTTILMEDRQGSAVVTMNASLPQTAWSYIFSVFTYKKVCTDTDGSSNTEYIHVPIEPTAAIARDPRKCWEPMTEKYTQSKEYLLPLSLEAATFSTVRSHGSPKSLSEQNVTKYLFDAGATFPGKGKMAENEWSGTDWIYKWYEKRGIVFDQVYGWEPSTDSMDKNELEPAMAKALHFFNVGITDGLHDNHNPLSRIRSLCKPKDIVVFKLDIDDEMELRIVKQLLSDPQLLSLVDEFYFEHHVHNDLMRMHGLGGNDQPDLKSWYDMVIPARRKGLHMHFWP